MAEQDLDRSVLASPYKLQKAKERGQVSKSTEVVTVTVFLVAIIYLNWKGWDTLQEQFLFDRALLVQAGQLQWGEATAWALASQMAHHLMAGLGPPLAALMMAAIVATLLQTGAVLSVDPIKADFDRLNPVNGFKKLLSLRTLFDTGRALVKLTLLAMISYSALASLIPQFFHLANLSPSGYLKAFLQDIVTLGLRIALVLALIAMVDLLFTRYEFAKKMRMSKREQKDEHKQREGDPRIRARLRELRREASRRHQAIHQTRNADVLLTNPTHVAVALRYEHGTMVSPLLVAKGAGHLAAAMRKMAAQHRIPIVQNPSLARRLYRELEIQQHVPQALYADVARIIVWIFAMRDQRLRASPTTTAGVPA